MSSQSASSPRLHALDSLRAVMMLLGVVLHGAAPYVATPFAMCPLRDTTTHPAFDVVLILIHSFRMPVFFVMAGFFAAMLCLERGEAVFISNRKQRILKPLLWFGALLFVPTTTGAWWGAHKVGFIPQDLSYLPLAIFMLIKSAWMHLWFLNHLLWLYAGAVLLRRRGVRPPDAWFRRALESPFRAVWLGWAAALLMLPMHTGAIDDSSALLPLPRVLLFYALFFGFGWMLYRSKDLLELVARRAWTHLALALALFPWNLRLMQEMAVAGEDADTTLWLATTTTSGLLAGLLTFAITGLFLRFLHAYSPSVRYMADASYWIYLVHMPLMVWLTALMATEPLAAGVKFLIGQVIAIPLLVLSYHFGVRSTRIGALLNGKRYPRSLPPREPAAAPSGAEALRAKAAQESAG
ncbi:MAG: acyltransferase family protein [Acidobacteria bacterium]|nr:acyltransferase family protein [Acidobacteriota bacterium]